MYKIIKDNKIIDVIKHADFIRFLPSGNAVRTCESLAEGIIGSDHKTIFSFGKATSLASDIVAINKISPDEFNRLCSLLNSNQVVISDQTLLNKAIDEAINSLSNVCNNKIISGFSIVLSDGQRHHFKLEPEDQINLLNLENQLNSGEELFVYHASASPCKVFMRNDMLKIIKAYRKHTLYHTTYFNTAKQYIKSLTDVDKINSFSYGTNIAGAVKDPILRKILMDGGVN